MDISAWQPSFWGPILWSYLHCLAEHVGQSGSTVLDTDQAGYLEVMLRLLPSIVPCTDCQQHATTYLAEHPLPALKGLYGNALTEAARVWLFDFHSAVRLRLGLPVMVATAAECAALYADYTVKKSDYTALIQTVGLAVRMGRVRMDPWKKWYSHSERLRVLAGNVVV